MSFSSTLDNSKIKIIRFVKDKWQEIELITEIISFQFAPIEYLYTTIKIQ